MTLTAAGSPYTSSGSHIDSGVTVTAEPGVVVKADGLSVAGTLDVNGSAANPVLFTSAADSAAGEWGGLQFLAGSDASVLDQAEIRYATNGVRVDGGADPTITNSRVHTNSAYGIRIMDGSSPEIAGSEVSQNAYDGINFFSGTGDPAAEVKIHDNLIEDNGGAGVWVDSWSADTKGVTLEGNQVNDNTGDAMVYRAYYGSTLPPDLANNPAPSGNGLDAIRITGPIESGNWQDTDMPIVVDSALTILAGETLTLDPGVAIKFESGSALDVEGAIEALGSAQEPVTFTSLRDDSIGGDTNADGAATTPSPGAWSGINITSPNLASTLDHTEIAYAGTYAAIDITGGASPTISNSNIHHASGNGIYAYGGASPHIFNNNISDTEGNGIGFDTNVSDSFASAVDIHDNTVRDNFGAGIYVTTFGSDSVGVSLSGNLALDNGGDAIAYNGYAGTLPPDIDENPQPQGNGLDALRVTGNVDSGSWQDPGYPLVVDGGLKVLTGGSLELDPGLNLKFMPGGGLIDVDGALRVKGTAADPVVLTSIKDDSAYGDTNADGWTTLPAPGDWRGIRFNAGSGSTGNRSTIEHAKITFGGGASYPFEAMIEVLCPCPDPPSLRRSELTDVYNTAIFFWDDPGASADGEPLVSDVFYDEIGGLAIDKGGNASMASPRGIYGPCVDPYPMGCGPGVGEKIISAPSGSRTDDKADCYGKRNPCPKGADPISLATGAFTYDHTDLSLPNQSTEDLEFVRSYDSADLSDAGLGPGWSHTALMRASETASGNVIVRQPDGRQDVYTKTGTTYLPPSGVHATLSRVGGLFRLVEPDRTRYDFDDTGRIDSITDDHGLVTDYAYDSNGRLASITDPSAQTLTFSYDASNHITEVTDSTGREVAYTYTGEGLLDTVTDPLQGITDYGYNADGLLTTIKDPRGVTFLTNTYDGQGRVIEQLDGENNLWQIDYGQGETTVTEPEAGEIIYGFDSQYRLTSETNQLGDATTYGYDAAGNRDRITRPGGSITTLDYDAAGNVVSATDPEGGVLAYTYDSLNRIQTMTDERSKTWTYTWDADNDLVQIEDPDGETVGLTHDAAGQPLTITDENAHQTTLGYDSRGNLTSETNPEGEQTTLAYNTRNQLTSLARPGLAAETYARNALGDLLSITTPEGHLTSFDYDENGALTGITDPALKTWTIERNDMELPTAYVDPLAKRTETTYDGNLNPISVTDRRAKVTTYAYDLANQLTEVDAPATGDWLFGYDARGNRDQMTDPRGNVTTYEHDLADRLTDAHEPLATNTAYGYDPAGNLTSVTDPRSNQTTFTYDDLGRTTQIAQPLGKTTNFGYDAAGNLTSRTTAEDAITFGYDNADRLTTITEGSALLRGFAYDDAGRLTQATDSQAKTIALGYDDDDNLVSINDGRGQTVARSFDSRGNLTQQVDGRGTISYVYDELSRMTTLTDPQTRVHTFGYDAEDNLTSVNRPNGIVTTNLYDDAGRMTETKSLLGTTTEELLTYTYDAAGNRATMEDRDNQLTSYAHDALNRLTQFDPPGTAVTDYGYDKAGNRTSAGTATYTYDALNQLQTGPVGTTFNYDGAGRLTQRQDATTTTSYGWNALDEMTSVTDAGGTTAFSYDGLGRRSERTRAGATETAHYGDLTDLPILDTNASGTARSFVAGTSGLIEERTGTATTYPLADAHGDVTAITNQSGGVASRNTYDPWGTRLTGTARQMGFLGAQQRRADPTHGLLQMGIRQYEPGLGKFLSEDPLIAALGRGQLANRYGYAAGIPLVVYDLDGRAALGPLGAAIDTVWDATADVRGTVEQLATQPGSSATEAVDYWAGNDSPVAVPAGIAASMMDLFINPDRLPHYLESHPWGGAERAGDCYAGLRQLRSIGGVGGAAYGAVRGAASAPDLGARGRFGVSLVSGPAGYAIGSTGGSLLGCGLGILAGGL